MQDKDCTKKDENTMKSINIPKIEIKKATMLDFDFYYKVKSEPDNIYWTGHSKAPNYEELKKWYYNIIMYSNKKKIYIPFYQGQRIGYLYVDIKDKNVVDLPIGISKKYQGTGLAYYVIKEFMKLVIRDYDNPKFVGWIFRNNLASQMLFRANGWIATQETKKVYLPLKNDYEEMINYVCEKNIK